MELSRRAAAKAASCASAGVGVLLPLGVIGVEYSEGPVWLADRAESGICGAGAGSDCNGAEGLIRRGVGCLIGVVD